jgi:2-amino-4-hydroxy-6-hydroxymethyldihydropteridine diphosphokinase
MRGIYIGLGSNLGDRLENLKMAVNALPPRAHQVAVSPVYETAPWGYLEQPAFLNQVIEVGWAFAVGFAGLSETG